MTRYLYAFVGPDADVGTGRTRLRGVRREPLRVIRAGTIHAVVGDGADRLHADVSNMRLYDNVMRRIWERHSSVVPARFGTVVPGEERLVLPKDRQDELRVRLALVRRRGQMTARIVLEQKRRVEQATPVRTGADYLRSRASALEPVEPPGFDALRRAVARWVASERIETRGRVTSAYHLVPLKSVDPYRRAFHRAARSAGLSIVLSGPYPPYAFASNVDEIGGAQSV